VRHVLIDIADDPDELLERALSFLNDVAYLVPLLVLDRPGS
jgi:hypothetical protein